MRGGPRSALAFGLLATIVVVAGALSRSPPVVAGTNGIPIEERLASTTEGAGLCQSDETIPAHTSAIRVALEASRGPRLSITVGNGSKILARGERGPGWTGVDATVPLGPRLPQPVRHASICVRFANGHERVSIFGAPTLHHQATSREHLFTGRLRIEYLRQGHSTWWSLATVVARHMGLGRAWAGTWIVLLTLLLMMGAGSLTVWLGLREIG